MMLTTLQHLNHENWLREKMNPAAASQTANTDLASVTCCSCFSSSFSVISAEHRGPGCTTCVFRTYQDTMSYDAMVDISLFISLCTVFSRPVHMWLCNSCIIVPLLSPTIVYMSCGFKCSPFVCVKSSLASSELDKLVHLLTENQQEVLNRNAF